jgi:hypothetical protein
MFANLSVCTYLDALAVNDTPRLISHHFEFGKALYLRLTIDDWLSEYLGTRLVSQICSSFENISLWFLVFCRVYI